MRESAGARSSGPAAGSSTRCSSTRATFSDSAERHAESEPCAAAPLIVPLACDLVEASVEVLFAPGSRLARAYGADRGVETYHCRYGLDPGHAHLLEEGPLRIVARDGAGEVRAVELDGHPFFVATLFQPERAALAGRAHPLINAFAEAASRTAPEVALR